MLILALAVGVADLAGLVGTEEENLAQPFVGINPGRKRCSVRDFQCHESLPLRFEWRYIDDDSATRIGGFANADREYIPGDAKVFNGTGQRERVGGDNDRFGLYGDKGTLVKGFGINNRAVDIGKYFEFVGDAQVIAVGREPVGNYAIFHLFFAEWFDHAMVDRLLSDPAVTLNGHETP